MLAVPAVLRATVLAALHDDPLSGHLGMQKTEDKVVQRYHWNNVRQDVAEWVRACDGCAM